MILGDTNFWLALSLSKHEFHGAARDWFNEQSAEKSVLFCRPTQQSLLRLLTTEAVMRLYGIPPMTNSGAWEMYEGIRGDRRIEFVGEPSEIEGNWKRWAARGSSSPKLWMDGYLAAFAKAGKYKLVTIDKGFEQFVELDAIILPKT